MHVLVIYAHPDSGSLSSSLKERFLAGLKKAGHTADVMDLYAEGFNPVMSAAEVKGETPPDVLALQERITKADQFTFIFPIWWFGAPAILEGFFDRVLKSGFAYHFKPIVGKLGMPIGHLKKPALVIESYGSPSWAVKLIYCDLPWRRIKRGILKFCGIGPLKRFSCFNTVAATPGVRAKWLEKVEKIGTSL
jgi:NAD(P)H dehydrogenase (quinone)